MDKLTRYREIVRREAADYAAWKPRAQFNGTDQPIAEELVRAGVPKEYIVLAEQPADVRPYTGYGVG